VAVAAELNILYADDEPDLAVVVVRALKLDPDVRVVAVNSGFKALELLERGEYRPDVVLLDVMMPDLDGPGTLERIAALPGSRIPVIFFTARAQHTELVQLADSGVIGILTKPFDPLSLAKDIRRILGKWDAQCRDGSGGVIASED
jgi:two-component system, OmpR family, response regulator